MHASAVPVWIVPHSILNWIIIQSNAQRLSDFTSPITALSEIHKKPLNGGGKFSLFFL